MPINRAIEGIELAIKMMNEELAQIENFSIFNYVQGSSDRTGEFTIIAHNSGKPHKRKSKESDAMKFFDGFIKKCELPNFSDKKFLNILNYVSDGNKVPKKSKDEILAFLKRKAAGLSLNTWISGNLKYKFNKISRSCIDTKIMNSGGIFALIIATVNLSEDGIIIMIEDEVKKKIEEMECLRRGEKPPDTNDVKTIELTGSDNDSVESTEIEIKEIHSEGGVKETESESLSDINRESDQEQEIKVEGSQKEHEESPSSLLEEPVVINGIDITEEKIAQRAPGFFGQPMESVPELKKENKQLKVAMFDLQQQSNSIKEELAKHDEIVDGLNNLISNLKAQIVEKEMGIQKLVTQNKNLTGELGHLAKDISKSQDNNKDLTSELEKIKKQVESLEETKTTLEKNKSELNDEINDLKSNVESLEGERDKISSDLDSANEKISEVTNVKVNQEEKIDSLEKKIVSLKSKLDSAVKEKGEAQAKSQGNKEEMELKISELEMTITEQKSAAFKEKSDFESQIKSLKIDLSEAKKDIEDLERRNAKLSKENKEVSSGNEDKIHELEKKISKINLEYNEKIKEFEKKIKLLESKS